MCWAEECTMIWILFQHSNKYNLIYRIAADISWASSSVSVRHLLSPLQWGAADAEIKVPSGENTELKRSPWKARSRSVYSHTCYAYCQEFLPCIFLPFRSIHLNFFQKLSRFFLCWLWLIHGSCVGPQNKIGHPAECRFQCWVPAEYNKAKKKNHDLWYDD